MHRSSSQIPPLTLPSICSDQYQPVKPLRVPGHACIVPDEYEYRCMPSSTLPSVMHDEASLPMAPPARIAPPSAPHAALASLVSPLKNLLRLPSPSPPPPPSSSPTAFFTHAPPMGATAVNLILLNLIL